MNKLVIKIKIIIIKMKLILVIYHWGVGVYIFYQVWIKNRKPCLRYVYKKKRK